MVEARSRALGILPALVIGQTALHATMAGLRMAAPLQALRDGYSALAVGVLLALFAALPVLTALRAGRMADRHGYHRPLRWAVALAMTGASLALASTFCSGAVHFLLLCAAAATSGTGANVGMICIQRQAGRLASDGTERLRVFSWLGVAPSMANVVGPVLAGFAIDGAGFGAAFGCLLVLPLMSLLSARQVPRAAAADVTQSERPTSAAWDLLRAPGLIRLLSINWLLSAS